MIIKWSISKYKIYKLKLQIQKITYLPQEHIRGKNTDFALFLRTSQLHKIFTHYIEITKIFLSSKIKLQYLFIISDVK